MVDDNSPDGTGSSPTRWRPRSTVAAPPGQGRARPRLHRRASPRAGRGAGLVVEMDADLSHDPADLPRLMAPRSRAPTSCSARATSTAAGSRTGAWSGGLSRAGCPTHGACWRRRARPDRRLQVLPRPPRCARSTPDGERPGLRLPGRADLARAVAGPGVVEVPIRFRERRLGESKMSAQIAREAAWRVPALRYGSGRWRPWTPDAQPADPCLHEG